MFFIRPFTTLPSYSSISSTDVPTGKLRKCIIGTSQLLEGIAHLLLSHHETYYPFLRRHPIQVRNRLTINVPRHATTAESRTFLSTSARAEREAFDASIRTCTRKLVACRVVAVRLCTVRPVDEVLLFTLIDWLQTLPLNLLDLPRRQLARARPLCRRGVYALNIF